MDQQWNLSIDRQMDQIRRRDKLIRQLWLLASVLFAIIFILAVMLLSATRTHASEACLTKAEARAKWPKDHLWWHTTNKCWDNNSGRSSIYIKRPRIAPDALPVRAEVKQIDVDANGNESRDECCWPSLKQLLLDRWRIIMDQLQATP